jgi:TatD DNase family protein
MFVDSHAHFDGPEYDHDRDAVVNRAREAGVRFMLVVGTGDPLSGSLERAVTVAEQYDGVFAAVGVHPHDAKLYNEQAEFKLHVLAAENRKVVAIGEIGLDYHYDHSPRETQEEVFRQQIALAQGLGLPIIVHSRAADRETVKALGDERGNGDLRGIMHCFGGSPEMAEEVLEMGFMISFAGNVTFKKAENLREAAKKVPLDRLLIETDCPYLSPVPYRGSRNEPARVVEIARCLGDLYDLSPEEIGRLTTANFVRFFGIDEEESLS